jgi:hypothetical protein
MSRVDEDAVCRVECLRSSSASRWFTGGGLGLRLWGSEELDPACGMV